MENPSIMSHVSVGTNNYPEAVAFYTRVLAVLGAKLLMNHPGAAAFGKQFPEFWVQTPWDGEAAKVGNGVHFAFFAQSRDEVERFHVEALEAGARDEGAPGERPDYGPEYYGCFVRDLDGNKIEACFWDTSRV
ncbi:MAG: VOC family protein [Myxococcota bacterium]